MRDCRYILCLIILAILGSLAIAFLFPPTQAYYYVQQGDTVYVNDTVDLSGVLQGVRNIAWYGGYDEESGDQYLLNYSFKKSDLYAFYIDPAIFGSRLNRWYKWNGYYEKNGNTLAFVVRPERERIIPNQSLNITLQNPEQIEVKPEPPILPIKHVSDYLIARGDKLVIPVQKATNAWIFGYRDKVYDYRSVNNTLELTRDVISGLSPGKYTLLLQTHRNDSSQGFLVRYNKQQQQIEWFDSASFKVVSYSVADKTPDIVLKKMQEIFPKTTDTFKSYSLEVEEPTISINQIHSAYSLNITKQVDYVGLDNVAFLDVRGYTNHLSDTVIKITVDPMFNVSGIDSWKDGIAVNPQGNPGDMRMFRVTVPIDKYNMPPGRHFIGARAETSGVVTTADFYIYDNPTGSYIPNKTIRYISGRYGDQELVPTPTPRIVEVTKEIIVERTITIPVTPPNEQVYAQQKIVADEKWGEAYKVMGIACLSSITLYVGLRYLGNVYRRARER